jgi:BirA family biotin operon repressor/biotin-[acetyl-CoA-carboxylase] ligase
MPIPLDLLQRLADGRFHSGQQLAAELGVSRAAVWKQVRALHDRLDLEVAAVRGRGYRLAAPLELLDAGAIECEVAAVNRPRLERLEIHTVTGSTNDCALHAPPLESGRARLWLAEHQTAGRGRRGRRWISSFGTSLYLSFAWRFDLPLGALSGLSLAAGAVTCEVLERIGHRGHCLKWPNDVLVDGRKLAGVLLEARGEVDGPTVAVIGIGINFRVPDRAANRIDQPWAEMATSDGVAPSRNRTAGLLADRLIDACRDYQDQGLAPFLPRWRAFDGLVGQRVTLMHGERRISGHYRGVSPAGAVILDHGDDRREYHAGEVSLRAAGET